MAIINGATAAAISRVTAWGQGKVWKDIDENVGYVAGGDLGTAVPIRRMDGFPPGPQTAAFVSAQLERAFELSDNGGREGGDWAKRMGIDVYAAPDENRKQALIAEMAANLIKFQHVIALVKLVPRPRNATLDAQVKGGDPDAASDQKYIDTFGASENSDRQTEIDKMTE
jgi:hypothetical protein